MMPSIRESFERDMLHAVSTTVRRVMACDAAAAMLPDAEGQYLRVHALDYPDSRGIFTEAAMVPIEGSMPGVAFQTGKPIVINRLDPETMPGEMEIRTMPMGMHTLIGEGAATFSGGEQQRLMIARAVVNKPRIPLFDEATSALDNPTQDKIQRCLEQLSATRVVIAHRLSTIRRAERIYVIDGGRIVEEGTYDDLLQRGGYFSRMAYRQV